jgi:hypothetical protein
MVTKRQLGLMVVAGALLLALSVVGVELLGAGLQGGLGPLQRRLLLLAALALLVGGVLISRGDRPA